MADTPGAPKPPSDTDESTVGRWIITAVVMLVFVVVLIVVIGHVDSSPTVVNNVVTMDTYQRSKDILTIVLPLATTVIGFWFGNQGASAARKNESTARADADKAKKDTEVANVRAAVSEHRFAMLRAALPENAGARAAAQPGAGAAPGSAGATVEGLVRTFMRVDDGPLPAATPPPPPEEPA
jgi:hypothetical protein